MDVIVNGVPFSTYAKVMDIKRGIMTPRELSTIEVAGKAGAHLIGVQRKARIFTVEFMIIGDVYTQSRNLSGLLDTDEPVSFVDPDDPFQIEYRVIVTGEVDLETILHTGRGAVTFIALDPYGYGLEETRSYTGVTQTADVITALGQVPTKPVITVTFKEDSEFFALTKGEDDAMDYLMVGSSVETSETPVQHEELILWDELDSMTGWIQETGIVDGAQVGAVMVSNGYRFSVPDYGTGTEWHGAAYKKALPEPLGDFLVDTTFTQRSDIADAIGRVQLHLLDANDNIVFTLTARRSDPSFYKNYVLVKANGTGGTTYLIDSKGTKWNYFLRGTLRLRREGDLIRAFVGRTDPVTGELTAHSTEWIYDTADRYKTPITAVMIEISEHSDYPNTIQYADDLKVWKVNGYDANTEVPVIFDAGDVLEIDTARNRVTKNGIPFMKHINAGSKFFALDPGDNTIGITSGGLADVEIKYRGRWN